ncbi:MAG TPA: cyclic nucleotide-binding domain-containing protein [Burkholderiales bacterium]|nr:cyclic nucleotide-binding domain-containing protein [Burkholderiales bacterium]
MEELDFTRPAAKSEIYDPIVALGFFKRAGRPETAEQGATIFAEGEKGGKMYYILKGEVALVRDGRPVDVSKTGEIIGEMALVSDQPRNATAVARTPCNLLAVDAKQLRETLRTAPEFALMLLNIMISRLRLTVARLSVTRALPQEERLSESAVFDRKTLAELVREFPDHPPQHHPLNKVLMKEGDAGLFMYVVVEGRVAISIQSRIVERLGPGGVFGEMALVDQSPRAASAVAETDCALLAINRNDFLGLVKTKPAFAVSLLKAVAERMHRMTARRA